MYADEQKLVALEEELRKDLEALERVKKLMALKNGSLSRPDDRQLPLPITSEKRGDTDDSEAGGPATSLIGTLDQIINTDPNVRWTNTKMLSHLQSINYAFGARKPIYSIGQAMSKLESRGKIRMVKRGAGSAPNIYKGKLTPGSIAEADSQGGDIAPESTVTE